MARNLLDAVDGFLRGKRYLLVDRDPLYTREFREVLTRAGTRVVRLPARSPNLNAFAERFVLSVRSECLDRIIPLGDWHLRHAVSEYLKHYHQERNHQGLGNVLIDSSLAANDNFHYPVVEGGRDTIWSGARLPRPRQEGRLPIARRRMGRHHQGTRPATARSGSL